MHIHILCFERKENITEQSRKPTPACKEGKSNGADHNPAPANRSATVNSSEDARS